MGVNKKAIKSMFERNKWKILRGDKVVIIAGKDKGETGIVSKVIRDDKIPRVIVEGRNLVCYPGPTHEFGSQEAKVMHNRACDVLHAEQKGHEADRGQPRGPHHCGGEQLLRPAMPCLLCRLQCLTSAFVPMQSPIHYSNVMLADPVTGKPVRVQWRYLEDGTKVRHFAWRMHAVAALMQRWGIACLTASPAC